MPHKKRPRMLFPSLWESEKIAGLSNTAFRLYIFLLSQADDDGRADYFLARLATGPWPMEPPSNEQVLVMMQQLDGLVKFYEAEDKKLYQILKWDTFQRIRGDRYEPSTYPAPPNYKVKKSVRKLDIPYEEILADLKEVSGKNFQRAGASGSEPTQKMIRVLWMALDGSKDERLEMFRVVHRNMTRAWGKDPKMRDYLRPATLYQVKKFEGYLEREEGKSKGDLPRWDSSLTTGIGE